MDALGFIGVAQSAGFKLSEIKELIEGVDSSGGVAQQMRTLSTRRTTRPSTATWRSAW